MKEQQKEEFMRSPFFCGVGGVVSADIAVPEHEREVAFYSSVLTTGESPLWREDLMNNQGTPIIGLGPRTPEYDAIPLQWMPHFQVADIAASVASAVELGGKELMHAKSEDGQSQWACVEDPDGGGMGLIPVVTEDAGYTQQEGPFGCIAGLSLVSSNPSASGSFYERVIGWEAKKAGDKLEMVLGNHVAAEIHQGEESDHVPPVWLIHIPVGDLSESLQRIQSGGGEVVNELAEGKSVIVRDPIGVHFALKAG